MSAVADGMNLAATRLRRPSSFAVGVAALGFVALDGLVEHHISATSAADTTLVGAVFGITIPLVAYLVSERANDAKRLDEALGELARHGADRRWAALGSLCATALLLCVAGAVLAALGALVARGHQVVTSAGIGALAGATYAAWFGAASTLGRRGRGRIWALLLDWLLGSGTTALALPWPRGHLRNLLGAEPVLSMPQWSASAALVVLALVLTAIALGRTAR